MVIKPYPKNAKKHPDKQLRQIADSVIAFGWQQPIVVDKEGVIIAGHGRWAAYEKYGLIKPPIQTADLTEEQANAYRLADNKLNESDWDMDLVIEELKDLSEPMIELTGFDKDLIIEPDEKDDEVPEVPEEPQSKLGDLYELGEHRVLCGDSTKLEDVEKLMDGKKADMVFTDPPYGVKMQRSATILGDEMDGLQELLTDAFANIVLSTKQNSPLYCWIGYKAYSLAEDIVKQNWKVNNCIVWKKPSIGMGHGGYRMQHELCIFSGNIEDRTQSDIWEVSRDNSGKHPTMKPVELVAKALTNSSEEDEVVLDLFLGSGSTLIAAEKTGRICYGMELDPRYVDVIVKRWEDYTGKTAIKQ